MHWESTWHMDVATAGGRKASQSHASDSPVPGEGRSPNGPARGRRAADRKAGGVVASSDDVSAATRFVGVSGDRFVGFEVQVALDGKAEFAAHGAKLDEAYVAEFRLAHA